MQQKTSAKDLKLSYLAGGRINMDIDMDMDILFFSLALAGSNTEKIASSIFYFLRSSFIYIPYLGRNVMRGFNSTL